MSDAAQEAVPRVFWPKEAALNQLMRVSIVRRRAIAWHRTGGAGRDGADLLKRLRVLIPFPLSGVDVLEIVTERRFGRDIHDRYYSAGERRFLSRPPTTVP